VAWQIQCIAEFLIGLSHYAPLCYQALTYKATDGILTLKALKKNQTKDVSFPFNQKAGYLTGASRAGGISTQRGFRKYHRPLKPDFLPAFSPVTCKRG